MYAVIKTGGKQYRVAADDILDIEKITGEAGSMVSFENVLLISGDGAPTVGEPMIDGASVTAEVLGQNARARSSSSRKNAVKITAVKMAIVRS